MLFPEFLSLFPFVLCIPLFIVNLFITFRGTKIFDSATKISYILLLRTDSGTIVSPFVESKLWGYPLGFSSEIVLKSFPLTRLLGKFGKQAYIFFPILLPFTLHDILDIIIEY